MDVGKNDQHRKDLARYTHINPKRGYILVDQISPVVIMKKVKLGPSDASEFASVTILPELTDADETQDLESQRGEKRARSVQQEEVSFIHTLTQEELNSHVQKCLEMSTENKINLKNAFALKLIDCFSFLEKKKDFSAMACTLDAGAKIYSCRVDALHQQVMKLADEVVSREKRTDKEDKDCETLPGNRTTKEQRKTRKNKLIASSETLNRKLKSKDPKDKYLRFEALPGAILSGARRDAYDLSLSLERYIPFWPNKENYKPLKAVGVVTLPDIKIFREKSQTGKSDYFPITKSLDQWQNNINPFCGDDVDANHIFTENPLSGEFVSIVDIPDSGPSEPCSGHDGDNHSVADDEEENVSGTIRLGEDEVGVVSTVMDRLLEEAAAVGAVNKAPTRTEALKILFDTSSEYDYLSMKSCNYWAGPEFWKRPQGRATSENIKTRVPNKKKGPAEIVYDFHDLEERSKLLSKKVSGLSDRTHRGWQKKKNTLPTDLKVDLSWFLHLFHIENSDETSGAPESVQNTADFVDVSRLFHEAEEMTDHSTDPFRADDADNLSSQDPLNATFYEAVTGQSASSEPRDPLESTFYDVGPSNKESAKIIRVEVSSSMISDFGESSMVPVPKMVNVVPIKYSTRPIRVDMRHLKRAMLEVIEEEIEEDARQMKILGGSDDGVSVSKPGVKFRAVLRSLPRKLDRRTRGDVSAAIAFTAVLSLTNENDLQLEKCNNGDFVVRFPDSPAVVSKNSFDIERPF